jgi:hypothetical protein
MAFQAIDFQLGLWVFTFIALLTLSSFAFFRVSHHAWFQYLTSLDAKTRLGYFLLPYSFSLIHARLMSYHPPGHQFFLEAWSPSEFILHDYIGIRSTLLHPYYCLSLDESRQGAQVIVYRKFRFEALLGILGTSLLISLLFHLHFSWSISLLLGLMSGLILLNRTDETLRPHLKHLLVSSGIFVPKNSHGGGEQQQWALH